MEQETLELYAPHNAKNLTQAEVAMMKDFTREDLKALAGAYPNSPTGGPYLILYDGSKPLNKQVFALSTWNNLYNLHKAGQKHFHAHSFKSLFSPKQKALKTAPVQDISKAQAKKALSTAAPQEVTAKQPAAKETAKKAAAKETEAVEVNLEKMSKADLVAHYKTTFKEDADSKWTKAELIELIQSNEQ